MNRNTKRSPVLKSGMTLSEIVIAIGIIAFTIPLILAATGNAHQTRQAAEADTRSAWLVRDVQRKIMNEWANSGSNSAIENTFTFPTSSPVTMELSFKRDGSWLPRESDEAVYVALVRAEPYMPNTDHSRSTPLARVTIKIQYPAKASPNHRKQLTYQFLSTRNGMP